jgi:hypothetical protein
MTITLEEKHLYIGIILVLMAIQIYQQYRIASIKREIESIWNQLGTLAFGISNKIIELQKDKKEDK